MKIASNCAERVVAVGRERHPGLRGSVRAPRQRLELERAGRRRLATPRQHLDRLGGDVFADAVAGDDCDAHGSSHS